MKQEQLQLTGGAGKTQRRELDFYPTPKECTHALMKFLHNNCDYFFDRSLHIWEPACGTGEMSEVIKEFGHTVISTDINTNYGIELDFFDASEEWYIYDAIITNPPFDLSQQFIEMSLVRSKIVCMLLKSQYWHAAKRYNLFANNPPQYVLPLTWRPDFYEHLRDKKGAPTMEVAWSVWIKGAHKETRYVPLLKPKIAYKFSNNLF